MQPLCSIYYDFILHFAIGSKINESVRQEFEGIVEQVNKTKFKVIFIASDGDTGSEKWHYEAFLQYEEFIMQGYNLSQILNEFKELFK